MSVENNTLKGAFFENFCIRWLRENIADKAVFFPVGGTEIHRHHILQGKSHAFHEFDAAICHRYPLIPESDRRWDSLVVVECKNLGYNVTKNEMAAFAYNKNDVNASAAIYLSASGYQTGAEAIAEREGIMTFSLGDLFLSRSLSSQHP